jgi:hypothetical protein
VAIGTPTDIGTGGTLSSAASVSFTSSAAVTAGNLVIVSVGYYGTQSVTISGGGLTWSSTDKTQVGVADANYHCGIWTAQAPSGVAISTVFTATFGASMSNPMIAGAQCSGLATSSVVDTTGGKNTTGTSTAWGSGNITTANANDLLWAACIIDGTQTSTPTAPSAEIHDFTNAGAGTHMVTGYVIKSATGTYAIDGVLSANNTLERVCAIVAYKDSGGGGGAVTPKQLAALGVG